MAYSKARALACAVAFAAQLAPQGVAAQEVQLISNDGSIDFKGELVDFSDGTYVLRTALGDFRLSAARVRCVGDACPQISVDSADVRISGSETVGEELLPIILAGYAARLGAEADVTTGSAAFEKIVSVVADGGFGDELTSFSIVSQGTDAGLNDLRERSSELAMASRAVRQSEIEDFAAAGLGNLATLQQERIVAVDSMRIIVSRDNPVDQISIGQLTGIYSGEITNWQQVGGPNAPINVYSRAEGSGTFDILNDKVLRPRRKAVLPQAEIVSGNIEMASSVAADPQGVGYVGYAFERGAKTLEIITECGLPVRADAFSAKTEEYPLERRLYVYSPGQGISESAAGLFEFMASAEVDGLVEKAGFVDLGVERRDQEMAASRLRDQMEGVADPWELSLMRELFISMQEWDRLSTTFRFAPGDSVLDNKAQRDLERVVAYAADTPGAELVVAGFTDADGPFSANLALAERRAAQVAEELRRAGGDRLAEVELSVKGFGELAPAGCNDSFEGKRINRRVEVWIKK
ncbi:MAG: phosphate ABC transporter substrate-binding/OmpA family protein [Pseudomonadota bacterium]